MMIFNHRVNHSSDFSVSMQGVEIDLRYHDQDIVLAHDPFHGGHDVQTFREFLGDIPKSTHLILNLKTEGIENNCIQLLEGRTNWFFLDMSMPYFVKFSHLINSPKYSKDNLCVRFSEYEPIEYALSFKNKVGWVWVDFFSNSPLTEKHYLTIKKYFKICLVSPELQGHDISTVKSYIKEIKDRKMTIDAVCSKDPSLWKE